MKTPLSVRKPVFLNSQCQTLIVIEASSFRNDFYTLTVDSKYSGTIGWLNSAKKCTQVNIIYSDITAIGSNGQFYKYYLNCNLNTLFFDGTVEGVAMTGVTAFAQLRNRETHLKNFKLHKIGRLLIQDVD
ncbi:unnamed protein product [Caenorhabditis brenneri]